MIETAIGAAIVFLMLGLWLGQKAEARIWRLKGDLPTRTAMYSGGKFYYVIPETEYVDMMIRAGK